MNWYSIINKLIIVWAQQEMHKKTEEFVVLGTIKGTMDGLFSHMENKLDRTAKRFVEALF